ncbi:MAG: nicotinate (nicotinamide) nucleotide adenylyltransferase [Lentisphaerae bacterium]|nr:nicotinate (nicotinamide) nucleotide adenylyltransferase [Lentisphaerota bacterium]
MNERLHSTAAAPAAVPDEAVRHSPDLPVARAPRLAVFGGSFDPIHNGHLALAEAVVKAGVADEVLFVPARRPPHKQDRDLSEGFHRLEMVRRAIEPYPAFSVSDIELERQEGFSYTFDTLTVLKQVFTEHEVLFLMGMDSLRDLHRWHRAGELVQHFGFIVYPRPGVACPSLAELSDRFGSRNARKLLAAVRADLPTYDLSATRVREACARGADPAHYCPDAVCRYIASQRLYRAQ